MFSHLISSYLRKDVKTRFPRIHKRKKEVKYAIIIRSYVLQTVAVPSAFVGYLSSSLLYISAEFVMFLNITKDRNESGIFYILGHNSLCGDSTDQFSYNVLALY